MSRDPSALRVVHRQGERLMARDLADGLAGEHRGWGRHATTVHRTWGIAAGLTVKSVLQGSAVSVAPGLAYTRDGAHLAVSRGLVLAAPTGDDALLVLGSSKAIDSCAGAHCATAPALRWRAPERRLCEEVSLALVRLKDGRVIDLDGSVRRSARGGGASRVRAGSQVAIVTAYSLLGGTIAVDTSEAGFVSTPRYFATLAIDPPGRPLDWPERTWGFLRGPLLAIRSEDATGFELSIRTGIVEGADDPSHLTKQLRVEVDWVGVEQAADEPTPHDAGGGTS